VQSDDNKVTVNDTASSPLGAGAVRFQRPTKSCRLSLALKLQRANESSQGEIFSRASDAPEDSDSKEGKI
jgi:hypothetical protein